MRLPQTLRGVTAWLPPDARVTVPAVYSFHPALHAVIVDDAGHAASLKGALLAGQIPTPRAAALGIALGQFLRGLHTWGRSTEEGGQAMRRTRCERLRALHIRPARRDATHAQVHCGRAAPPCARRRATWRVGGDTARHRGAG